MKNPSLEIDGTFGDYTLMENLVRQKPEALAKLYGRYRDNAATPCRAQIE